jgi:hypothetical protein
MMSPNATPETIVEGWKIKAAIVKDMEELMRLTGPEWQARMQKRYEVEEAARHAEFRRRLKAHGGGPASYYHQKHAPELGFADDVKWEYINYFGHFGNRNIYASTNGTIVSENAAYRAQLLADAIPAESFAVGANPVPLWNTNGCVNVNMASRFKDDHQFYKSPNQNWIHSFFLMAPYMCIHGLYDDVVSRIPKETSNE